MLNSRRFLNEPERSMTRRSDYLALVQHVHFLRVCQNLAHFRAVHSQFILDQRAADGACPPNNYEEFLKILSTEIGGTTSAIASHDPLETALYELGPTWIGICLLSSIFRRYAILAQYDNFFQSDSIDTFCQTNKAFLDMAHKERNTILYHRAANIDASRAKALSNNLDILAEGLDTLEAYLQELSEKLGLPL